MTDLQTKPEVMMKLHEINFDDIFWNVWQDSVKKVFFNAYTINAERTLRTRFENVEALRTFTENFLKNNQDIIDLISRIAGNVPEITRFNRAMSFSNQKTSGISRDHGWGIGIDPDLNQTPGAVKSAKSELSNNNSGESTNWSANLLMYQDDIVNLPVIKKYFDSICEVWIWP